MRSRTAAGRHAGRAGRPPHGGLLGGHEPVNFRRRDRRRARPREQACSRAVTLPLGLTLGLCASRRPPCSPRSRCSPGIPNVPPPPSSCFASGGGPGQPGHGVRRSTGSATPDVLVVRRPPARDRWCGRLHGPRRRRAGRRCSRPSAAARRRWASSSSPTPSASSVAWIPLPGGVGGTDGGLIARVRARSVHRSPSPASAVLAYRAFQLGVLGADPRHRGVRPAAAQARSGC